MLYLRSAKSKISGKDYLAIVFKRPDKLIVYVSFEPRTIARCCRRPMTELRMLPIGDYVIDESGVHTEGGEEYGDC